MKVSIVEYAQHKELILKKYNECGLHQTLEIAVSSYIPLIAVYTYLNEEFGGFDYIIDELIDFYGYTEIVRE